jgi:sporulation protein YlmC with PRC-barrel domain
MRLSQMYGMDIFTDGGKYVGTAHDFIVDVEKGEVVRILLENIPRSKEEAKRVIKEKSVLYNNVRSVEDVIVVSAKRKE